MENKNTTQKDLIKHIKVPIYLGELILIQTEKIENLEGKYGLTDLKNIDAFCYDYPYKDGSSRYILAFEYNTTPKIIAHEAFHLVSYICRDRQMRIDLFNDEPQAYLIGWIVEQCHKYLQIKNILKTRTVKL